MIWRRRPVDEGWLISLSFPLCPQDGIVRKNTQVCYALVSPSHAHPSIFPFPVRSLEIDW